VVVGRGVVEGIGGEVPDVYVYLPSKHRMLCSAF
jgi:hypothetical protein